MSKPTYRKTTDFASTHFGRIEPVLRLHVHACMACGSLTTSTWFCLECRERAAPHLEDDPYDDLGGESGLSV